MKRIILSVTNDLVTDQRVHRVATTLMNQGAEVTLVGRILPNSLPVQRAYSTHRMRLLFKRSVFFYAEYNLRLFFHLLFKKVDILVSNDLDTLLANYLVSVIRRKQLVYDSHEYFTGVPELIGRNFTIKVWHVLEGWILPKVRYSYTVCESIANVYHDRYGINMNVVRNLPMRITNSGRNERYLALPQTNFVLYQGCLNQGRGLEGLIGAFEYLDDIKCVIVGDGDIKSVLQQKIISKKLTHKVILLGKIPFDILNQITPYASLGVSIEENISLNYYYSLPNKLFDYIQAEVPVLCSNLVEVANIVNTWKIGMITESHDPSQIAAKIKEMLGDPHQMEIWKKNITKAAAELCWENEEKQLMKIYSNLL